MKDATLTKEYASQIAKGAAKRAAYETRSLVSDETLERIASRQASWQEVEGVEVMRINNERFVAVPVSGRKNSASFEVIDMNDRSEVVCVLKRAEVQSWFFKAVA